MNYEEAIQLEIKKRETNAIIQQVEKMTNEELYSEAERIKASKPKKTEWGVGDPLLRDRPGGDMGIREGQSFFDWVRSK